MINQGSFWKTEKQKREGNNIHNHPTPLRHLLLIVQLIFSFSFFLSGVFLSISLNMIKYNALQQLSALLFPLTITGAIVRIQYHLLSFPVQQHCFHCFTAQKLYDGSPAHTSSSGCTSTSLKQSIKNGIPTSKDRINRKASDI